MASNDQGGQYEGDRLLVQSETLVQHNHLSSMSQKQFDENYEFQSHPPLKFKQIVTNKVSKCHCSRTCIKGFIYSIFPFITIMKNYQIRESLPGDIVAGLTIGIMHIPQGWYLYFVLLYDLIIHVAAVSLVKTAVKRTNYKIIFTSLSFIFTG
ncbi:sulfate transporter-like [Ruditapes philippinarum]|uniref:sulfate transporter-like n=1 Tax=Ruditapes philippinarum TaxID=129788 RepID=UPI00295C361F|nr:sulfate transporter-like [Ruditapes philippinarum]